MDDRFCELAVAIGIGSEHPHAFQSKEGKREMALGFVRKVRAMNAEMNIPTHVTGMSLQDAARVGTRALTEGNGEGKTWDLMDFGYPCMKTMVMGDMMRVCSAIVEPSDSSRGGGGGSSKL